ncbi:putative cytokinin riboside 5'-monophosphate phosphoribohydrolase [Marinobacterium zhoushanense]|uniref:Cytokinin riboside 5'-monophosphate phosphoribohydrolase n=1 Tax=Marinobacterium zhoushanense TaxID=1679163 RepID=A0ABQ1KT07_9GAMM|nr:TIGR00730 family Rossman fold protein [Marinobacterium zhoushanense]GGC10095.1 putative cytokinin riboside 5'-monophosphate phosphoribohydrolase [Marinobacterium zhoushanense]
MASTLCVFCGSSDGTQPAYRDQAYALGAALVKQGSALVYGGGSIGLMGAVADGVMDSGGKATGVIPESLFKAEVAHQGLTSLEVVPDMHARKARMAELADAFVALPGGIGTFEELFEVWTWAQLGYHDKPIGLLNLDGFYDPLLAFLGHTEEQGFIRSRCRELLWVEQDIAGLLARINRGIELGSVKWDPEKI